MSYKGFTTGMVTKPPRSTFDLSHESRLSTRFGKLTPVFISETLPNDTFSISSEIMLRLAPMLAPIFHRVNVFVHFFFVPNRLLWRDWENFITGGRLGETVTTPPVPPNMTFNGIGTQGQQYLNKGKLFDYLGGTPFSDVACGVFGTRTLDVMPFCAYQKVWQDYYRDRNFVADSALFPLASGTTTAYADILTLRYRNWMHDYFTSALPFTQRGTEVLMPLQGSGNVTYLNASLIKTDAGAAPAANTLAGTDLATGNQLRVGKTGATNAGVAGRIENIQSVNFNVSDVTINEFRTAIALQRWLERNAVGGSRYNETIWNHFMRRTGDARLQRAEYLGGGKVPVTISEVVAPNWSTDGTDQLPAGNMAGHGLTYGNTNRVKYNCPEHGFIIGIMSIMPTSGYMQGIPRMFLGRNTFLDYPWPSFANLGEQPVYNYEIYGVDALNVPIDRTTQPVFGYQSRYADWKFIASNAKGDFRDTLDFWHLTRKFAATPVLGSTFNAFEDTLQNRVFAVADGTDNCWCYIYNKAYVKRALPYFNVPSSLR